MNATRKKFAHFYSPGTFFHEERFVELQEGTVEEAVRLAKDVSERHNAKPFGFDIVTKIVAEPINDGEGGELEVRPKEVEREGRFYLGGKLINYEEVCKEHGDTSVIASNMRNNGHPICIEVVNGFKSTNPFGPKDAIVDPETGEIQQRGDDTVIEEYREVKISEWKSR